MLIILIFSISTGANAVPFFSKNILASKFSANVTLNGIPQKDIKVVRYIRWSWDDKKRQDETTTDKKGDFTLPIIEVSQGLSRFLPHEPVVFQQITITYKGEKYVAWQHSKHNYDNNGELNGKSLALNCELSNKPEEHNNYVGICTVNDDV